ncbi:MAG: serine hydrolase [Cyanobacteria bacterium J06607_10]
MKFALTYPSRFLQMATAYKAKLLCSGIFVSGRKADALLSEDLAVDQLAPLRLLSAQADYENQLVTVSCLGGFQSTALYRPGLGSTLVFEGEVEELKAQSAEFCQRYEQTPRKQQPLPIAQALSNEIDTTALTAVIDQAFNNKAARTRTVVILHKGEMIAERYAPGFDAHTPMMGWSLSKSVVNALIGILIHQGKLSLSQQDLLPEWRQPGDPRREITLDQLLRMSSGLTFSETYASPLSDATTMLFQTGDRAAYAAQLSLKDKPGTTFNYSSGTTVLLCRIIRNAISGSLTDYFAFPRQALFDPLGMTSAVMEPDAAGTFTGSSFIYATAQDWAKLGLLYLQDGCWQSNGRWMRLLPEGWVNYSSAPSEAADFYGAHWWRGVPNSFTDKARSRDDSWPKDAYLAAGYQGQFVTVIPSCKLVVVRLGLSQRQNSWDQVKFIGDMMAAVKSSKL